MALQQPCHTALADQRRTYCREGNRAKGFRPYGEKTRHRARFEYQHHWRKYRSAHESDPGIEHRDGNARQRSEEHTSELQSLMRISYAVFCLKKKKRETR